MTTVRGIYDGRVVRLLEPLPVPANTEVKVSIPDDAVSPVTDAASDDLHWQRLIHAGLIKERPHPEDLDDDFEPIPNPGEPISDTNIRERR